MKIHYFSIIGCRNWRFSPDISTANDLVDGDIMTMRMESSEHCPIPANAWSAPKQMYAYSTGLVNLEAIYAIFTACVSIVVSAIRQICKVTEPIL